tara:strand:+ start:590 stop:760 length:171 start_codon:yes stop_codon:yes gene_type:complete
VVVVLVVAVRLVPLLVPLAVCPDYMPLNLLDIGLVPLHNHYIFAVLLLRMRPSPVY